MTSTIVSLALVLAAGTSAWPGAGPSSNRSIQQHVAFQKGGRILPNGPGAGWGFPNGNPDGYGWFDIGDRLPLGGNRVPEYYFPRFNAVPPPQLMLPTYYNPYLTRGQRYVGYTGCGGAHPAGGPPMGSAETPVHPYQDTIGAGPKVSIPAFSGRVESRAIPSGGSGLTP